MPPAHRPARPSQPAPTLASMFAPLLALACLATLAACNPEPTVERDPDLDEQLLRRYQTAQADGGDADTDGTAATRSGLRYVVLEPGDGDTPGFRDRVTVHYRGFNEAGQVFDDSYERGRPARFQVSEVIDGWAEGLQLMREGARYRFIIPPYLAYGQRGSPPRIGPNETLTFEVELIAVN